MKVDTTKLVKVSTYATSVGMSAVWISTLIKRGDLKGIKIDGVQFVIVEDKE